LTNFTSKFRVNHPTKGEIWVEGRSTPTRQPDGSILWHGVLTDVTDRKHAQEELEKERTLLRTLLDTLPDIIFTKDTAGRLVMGNKAHLALFGVTNEADVAGKNVFDLHPRHLAEGYHADDMLVLQQGQAVVNREELIRGADGREEWYLVIKVPLRDREGKITGLVGLCRNIQDRKAAVESLRASNELFHYVSLATHDAIYDWQIEAGIIWRNETYQKLYSPDQPLGQDDQWWIDRVHPEDRQGVLDSIDLGLHNRSAYWSGEYRFQRSDGTYANVMDRGYILYSPEGKPARMIGAMSDISEFKQLEEQLLQAQKMEAVGQLAGGVAHDFNNLLTTVLGYSELLLADLPPDDLRRSAIEEIKKSGTRAAALTQQLLAFSRKQMLQPQILDLNGVVGDITTMLRRLIGENIRLQLRCQEDLWSVKADPHQLQQVIVNLVVNARDAMPAGGEIIIGTQNVEIDDDYVRTHVGAAIGSHVRLTVTDTGKGMTEEVKKRIFEPFFTTKGLGKGTGLGLATVYGIIKQSGGYIWVDSSPETGTTFTILLPRAPVSQAASRSGSCLTSSEGRQGSAILTDRSGDGSPVPTGSETILLVEDEDGVRDLAQLSLASCGYQVLSADNGEAALALAARYPGKIHLLFTDLLMPGMSGTELAAKLLAAQPNIKILYMSGYTEDVVSRHPIGLAGPSLLQKPFSHRVLADKVREVLDFKVNCVGLKQ
jgi:PAS domain S-box-containing protein